jgi:hypothetical protein
LPRSDEKLAKNSGDGYRDHRLPPLRDAWRTGLAALDDESRARFELPCASIEKPAQLALLAQIQRGERKDPPGNACHRTFFSAGASSTTCAALTTLIPARGAKWVSVARPTLAVMCACIPIGGTIGKLRKQSRAMKKRLSGRIDVLDDIQRRG